MPSREQILRLISQYCFTLDSGDMDAWAELFEHGEWGVDGGTIFVGKAQVREAIKTVRIYPDGTPRTKHMTANIDLDIDEKAGTASSQCYVTVFQQTDALPLQAIFSGHYFDEFSRIDGVWCFRKRLIRHPLVGDLSAHHVAAGAIMPNA